MKVRIFEDENRTSGRYRYATTFKMDEIMYVSLEDWQEAYEYLKTEDAVKYYDGPGREKLKCINWRLWEDAGGYVYVDSYEELSDEEKDSISEYIKGQSADGIGENLEQMCTYRTYYDEDENEVDESDDWETYEENMCQIDWRRNSFELHRYGDGLKIGDPWTSSSVWPIIDKENGKWE